MCSWNPKANEIFADASEFEDDVERWKFVDARCGDDHELRQHVEALLHAQAPIDDDYLSQPIGNVEFSTLDVEVSQAATGTAIDGYRLLQQIGEGGFGVVYMAEQKEPIRRKVALKIIKAGMDTKEVIARFEAERQALAIMDHPNIAKVMDGGTTALGRPYFVMELVKGVPITEFCDANTLSTTERLELFATVCKAVQHAHQKGVIHRDLKPSNVLVTISDGEPMPKVIDFGVAKAINQELTEKTLFTAHGQMVGTPQYMSPEQAQINAIDVDTRTDVYSLGILLYELLTGSTPLDPKRLRSSGYDEMRRLIREEDTTKPSARLSTLGQSLSIVASNRAAETAGLQKAVSGELDWIVMKAVDKDRRRRYETAIGFADDIKRYLAGGTVEAVAPTIAYRARKFLGRNRLAATTVAVVALMLVAAVGASMWKAQHSAAQANTLRQEVYASDMNRAARYLEVGNLNSARSLLEKYRSPDHVLGDLRGFEWRYLWDQSRRDVIDSFPTKGSEVAVSRDGKLFAYNMEHRVVVREQARPFRVVKELDIKWIAGLSFSGDGKLLAAAVDPGAAPGGGEGITVFDTDRWDIVKSWAEGSFPMNFSPDGNWLAFRCHDVLQVVEAKGWDTVDTLPMSRFGESWWYCRDELEFSSDGELLIFLSPESPGIERRWQFYRLAQRRIDEQLSQLAPAGMAISLSPDGRHFAASAGIDQSRIEIYDIDTRKRVATSDHGAGVVRVEYSPDGKYLISSGGNLITIWDTNGYGRVRSAAGANGTISLAVGSQYIFNAVINKRPIQNEEARMVTVLPLEPTAAKPLLPGYPVGFSRAGNLVTVDVHGSIRDSAEGEPLFQIDHKWRHFFDLPVDLTSDDKLLVGRENGTLGVWDLASRTLVKEILVEPNKRMIKSIACNPQNPPMVVVGSKGGSVSVWNIEQRRQLSGVPPNLYHNAVYFSGNGRQFGVLGVSVDQEDKGVRIFDINNDTVSERFSVTGICRSMCFSHDGEFVAASLRGDDSLGRKIVVYDAQSGKEVNRFEAFAKSMSFSPDGKTIAADPGRLFHVATGVEMLTVQGPPIPRVIFDPHSSARLVLGSRAGNALVEWDLRKTDDGRSLVTEPK